MAGPGRQESLRPPRWTSAKTQCRFTLDGVLVWPGSNDALSDSRREAPGLVSRPQSPQQLLVVRYRGEGRGSNICHMLGGFIRIPDTGVGAGSPQRPLIRPVDDAIGWGIVMAGMVFHVSKLSSSGLNCRDNIAGWRSLRLSESTGEQAVEWNGGDGSGTRATFPALAGLTRAAAVLSRMYCVGRRVYLAPLVRPYCISTDLLRRWTPVVTVQRMFKGLSCVRVPSPHDFRKVEGSLGDGLASTVRQRRGLRWL